VSTNLDGTPRERLAANLKTPYSAGGEKWSALLDAFAAEFEELEAVREQVRAAKFVETADAASLERLAKRFDLERRTNEPLVEFRARVKVALRSQLSSGTLSEIREVITVLLDIDRQDVELREPDDEAASLNPRLSADVMGQSEIRPQSLNESLQSTTAAGVAVKATFEAGDVSIGIDSGDTLVREMYRSPDAAIGVDAGDTTSRVAAVGLSSADLGPLSSSSWLLSTRRAPAARIGIAPGDTVVKPMTQLSTATVGVAASGTVVAVMTRASAAEVGVSPSSTQTATLATRGLSAGELGGLSTTDMDTLA